MSLRRPSLRLALGLALFVLATAVAPASAAPRQVSVTPAPAAFPASSCHGVSACLNATGPIGENSCNGDFACKNSTATIGDNSCNGYGICYGDAGNIGNCANNSFQPAACDTQPDARIRRIGRHNLVGNNIYNTDATDQTLTATLTDAGAVRFSITMQNDSDVADSFTLDAPCTVSAIGADVGATYTNITIYLFHGWPKGLVESPTPTIAPGGKYRLRAVIKPIFSPALKGASSYQLSCLVSATSVGNPANSDAVRFIVNLELTPTT